MPRAARNPGRFCRRLLSALTGLALLCGCATDSERTTTEGALLGTALGAGVGAGVGYLAGGGSGAGYGAIIGAAGGLVGGAAVGKHVAKRKVEFAKSADYVEGCIAAAYNADQQLILHNRSLAAHLAELDSEIADSSRREPDPARHLRQQMTITADLQSADDRLAQVQEEIALQSAVLETERPAQSGERVRRLESEIESLERRKAELETMIQQLRTMDNRMLASQ